MKKLSRYLGFTVIGFSIVLWLFNFEAFKGFIEIAGKFDIWGLVLKIIITTVGVFMILLDRFLKPKERYLSILEDGETGIQVSEHALNSMVMAVLSNNVEGIEIKSCNATEQEGEIKISLILEFTDSENVNEASRRIIDLLKSELASKLGVLNIKVQIIVQKLSFQG